MNRGLLNPHGLSNRKKTKKAPPHHHDKVELMARVCERERNQRATSSNFSTAGWMSCSQSVPTALMR